MGISWVDWRVSRKRVAAADRVEEGAVGGNGLVDGWIGTVRMGRH